jgi:zinc finger protein
MRTLVPSHCPLCQREISFIYQTEDIPFFRSLLIISARCEDCGFRYTDTQLLANSEPSRWELAVRAEEDLSVRVVRSMQGAVSIPELGVRIDPGPACEGFISNVEGVLSRIESVAAGIAASGDEDEREAAVLFLEKIHLARDAAIPFTLIIEDPTGNSAILADAALVTPFVPENPDDEEPGETSRPG